MQQQQKQQQQKQQQQKQQSANPLQRYSKIESNASRIEQEQKTWTPSLVTQNKLSSNASLLLAPQDKLSSNASLLAPQDKPQQQQQKTWTPSFISKSQFPSSKKEQALLLLDVDNTIYPNTQLLGLSNPGNDGIWKLIRKLHTESNSGTLTNFDFSKLVFEEIKQSVKKLKEKYDVKIGIISSAFDAIEQDVIKDMLKGVAKAFDVDELIALPELGTDDQTCPVDQFIKPDIYNYSVQERKFDGSGKGVSVQQYLAQHCQNEKFHKIIFADNSNIHVKNVTNINPLVQEYLLHEGKMHTVLVGVQHIEIGGKKIYIGGEEDKFPASSDNDRVTDRQQKCDGPYRENLFEHLLGQETGKPEQTLQTQQVQKQNKL